MNEKMEIIEPIVKPFTKEMLMKYVGPGILALVGYHFLGKYIEPQVAKVVPPAYVIGGGKMAFGVLGSLATHYIVPPNYKEAGYALSAFSVALGVFDILKALGIIRSRATSSERATKKITVRAPQTQPQTQFL